VSAQPDLKVYDLGHLGLVASVLDRIQLVETVDRLVGPIPGEKVPTGMALKAAILNALGFVASPLYLFGHFFQGKPTELLLPRHHPRPLPVRALHADATSFHRTLEGFSWILRVGRWRVKPGPGRRKRASGGGWRGRRGRLRRCWGGFPITAWSTWGPRKSGTGGGWGVPGRGRRPSR